jgi:hypothetical protein
MAGVQTSSLGNNLPEGFEEPGRQSPCRCIDRHIRRGRRPHDRRPSDDGLGLLRRRLTQYQRYMVHGNPRTRRERRGQMGRARHRRTFGHREWRALHDLYHFSRPQVRHQFTFCVKDQTDHP